MTLDPRYAAQRAYQKRNPEKHREAQRRYRERYPERVKATEQYRQARRDAARLTQERE